MKMKKIDISEVEGFRLGTAEDAEAGTGVTVIISETGAVAGVDVRGGAPATRETDLLRSENTVDMVNAVVISGGSAFGLEAGSGVMKALAERNIGYNAAPGIYIPIVPGASLYDLSLGRADVYPDVEMGRRAVDNAFSGIFESGNHGAGTGASVGKYMGPDRSMKTGLGTFACGDDLVQVGAIAAVNAVGDIYNGAGNIIAGLRSSDGTEIKGTIRVLKGMVHEGSSPDLNLKDIRNMAVAEALQRVTKVSHESEPQQEKAEPVSNDEKDDIVRAMMQSYEQETAQPADPEPAPEETSQEIEAAVSEEYAPDTAVDEEPAVEDAYLEMDDALQTDEAAAEQESAAPDEQTAEIPSDGGTYPDEAAANEEEETPAQAAPEDDEYVLTDEDRADMGYDIPFNTTVSCLITNAVLTKAQANKLATILHDAYARAIKPVHSTMDGDTVFVMSTCTQEVNFDAFAALATDVLQYAIIDGATSATGAYGLPAARDMIHK